LLDAAPEAKKIPAMIDPREVRVSESALKEKRDVSELGTPSHFTCPACSGTLWEFDEGNMTRFRCRTGHAYSLDSMMVDQSDALERALWTAARTLDEKADLMKRVAGRAENPDIANRFEKRAREAEAHARLLRDMLASMSGTESSSH
jgi:two-component system, chemotaxis family, protein-glutamate methylesterase/glutaminase